MLTILNSIGLASTYIAIGVNLKNGYPLFITELFSFFHLKHRFGELSFCFLYSLKSSCIFRRMNKLRLFLSVLLFISMVPAHPADESVFEDNATLGGWSNGIRAGAFEISFDTGALEVKPEAWWQRWGLSQSYFQSELRDVATERGLRFVSVDAKRRLFTTTQNSFVALGLGWKDLALGDVGENDDTRGPRLSLEGQWGVAPLLHLYGHSAWFPNLEDTERLKQPNGFELEAGFTVKPLPHLSFRAGYRELRLDFKSLQGANESSKSQGVVLGAGIHW